MSRRPGTEDVVIIADHVELYTYTSRRGRVSRSKIDEIVSMVGGLIDDEEKVELLSGRTLTELRRRGSISGTSYPFKATADAVSLTGSSACRQLYLFLMLFSVRPETRVREGNIWPDRIFERVTAKALESWTAGTSLVFAEVATLAGVGIRSALIALGEQLGVEARPHLARKARQDHGLDVISWRRFRDRHDGVPLVLCQCTVGRTNHVAKARDISANEWCQLLAITPTSVVSSLAIPHVLGIDYEHWWELKTNTELILDRMRILELIDPDAVDLASIPGFMDCLELMTRREELDLTHNIA